MAVYWYALQSKPNKEEALYDQLVLQGFEAFYPRIRVKPVNPRAKKIKAYFPGYMFVHADIEQVGRSIFQYMPFSRGIVTFDWEPAAVPDTLIHALQKRLGGAGVVEENPANGLQKGDLVMIQHGPFAGYEAIFDLRLPGSERVRVLIKLLSERQVPLELHSAQIRKEATQKGTPAKGAGGKKPGEGNVHSGEHHGQG